jgi:Tfp pilus assembly protein PilW
MVELLITMVLSLILIAGIVDIFVSGGRAGADANARIDAQQQARLALDRLEFEGRCATSASLLNSGAGVAFALPAQCSHGSGNISWCVVGGVLTRFTMADCTGSNIIFVRNITTATPFTINTNPGDLPQLLVTLTSDDNSNSADEATLDDTITLRNAAS